VVWQGSAGDRRPYADLTRMSDKYLGYQNSTIVGLVLENTGVITHPISLAK
jgi:hypothetical protein